MSAPHPCIFIVVVVSATLLQDEDSPHPVTVRDTSQLSDAQQLEFSQSLNSNHWADSAWHPADRPLRLITGKWQLEWNDAIGEVPQQYPHRCSVGFKEVDGLISGDFLGPVAGRERDAILSGRLEGVGPSRVFVLQQRENGYVCSYQAIDNGDEIFGVWHDTENRSGRFRLLKLQ